MCRFAKRLTALVLSVILFFAAVPVGALRALAVEGDTVYIGSVSDLEYLAEKCVQDVWSQGVTVLLTTDLDLSGSDFTCIPLFSGAFDGQGYTISGLSIAYSGSRQGLFRQLLSGSLVQDLNVSGSVLPDGTRQDVGGIAGINYGTIQRCSFSGTVGGTRAVGGIAGINQTTGRIFDCRVDGMIGGEHRTGGIAGENLGIVSGCENRASINTTYQSSIETQEIDASLEADELLSLTDAGGIVGYSSGSIENCTNNGAVGYNHVGYNIGGIAGRQSGRVENCTNNGTVLGRKDVGGILGQMDPDTGWNFTTASLGGLQGSLDELQEALNEMFGDLNSTVNVAGGTITSALNSIKRAGNAAQAVLKDTEDWANANLSTLNDLSNRVTLTLQKLGPILRQLAGITEELSSASNSLSGVLEEENGLETLTPEQRQTLEQALADLDSLLPSVSKAADSLSDTMDDLEATNSLSSAVAAWKKLLSIPGQLLSISGSLEEIVSVIRSILALAGIGSLAQIAEVAGQIADSLDSLRSAAEMLATLADDLGSEPALQFTMLETSSAAQEELFAALNDVSTSIGSLKNELSGSTIDFQTVTDKFFAVLDTALGMLDDSSTDPVSYTEDVSALEDENRTSGIVRGCTNYGSVKASTNVGGITGAITVDLTLDEENTWNLSSLLGQGARYLIYAAVYNCGSYAAVQADSSNAGGIAGRMDYGAVLYCESSGDITSAGDYAGGIAGQSTGTIHNCKARVNLSGGSYVGGIAGLGTSITNCFALPHITQYTEYAGAIAGTSESPAYVPIISQPIEIISAIAGAVTEGIASVTSTAVKEGIILENYYAESAIGGVDGFSFSGEADPVTYEQLLALTENAALFSSITVSFVVEGKTISQVELPFGGALPELPDVPDKDGKYWVWDSPSADAIYYSCAITGSYRSLTPTLATSEEAPLFLVEGAFYEGQFLTAQPYAADLASIGAEEADVLAAYTLMVSGTSGALTARLRTQDAGKLYVLDENGALVQTQYTRDGSYIVFPIQNGGSLVYVKTFDTRILFGIGGGAAAAVLLAALWVRRRKRRVVVTEDFGEKAE